MFEDKDYDSINCKYIGSEYGDLRRERAKLQQRMIAHNDESVKPRIREITLQLQALISSHKLNDKAAKNLHIRPRLKLNLTKGNNMDELIGAIKLVAFNYDPEQYMACDGRTLSIRQYQALFALLGCTHGGDGISTFALPNLPSPQKGLHYIIAVEGVWPQRQ